MVSAEVDAVDMVSAEVDAVGEVILGVDADAVEAVDPVKMLEVNHRYRMSSVYRCY